MSSPPELVSGGHGVESPVPQPRICTSFETVMSLIVTWLAPLVNRSGPNSSWPTVTDAPGAGWKITSVCEVFDASYNRTWSP